MPDFKDFGSGALFINKKDKDTQPDYAGPLTVEGRKYRMVAWTGTDKFGKTMLSVKVNEWREPKEPPAEKPAWRDDLPESDANSRMGDLDDEVIF